MIISRPVTGKYRHRSCPVANLENLNMPRRPRPELMGIFSLLLALLPITAHAALPPNIEQLETLRVHYMLVGPFSSNIYGIPRSTKHADIVGSPQRSG